MAKIYKRENKSSYWWANFKDPSGKRIRRSTSVNSQEELANKAQLKANQMELEAWENWSPGKEKLLPRTFEELTVKYLQESDVGRGHKDNIKQLRQYFAGKFFNSLDKKDVFGYVTWRRPRNKRFPDRPVSNNTIRRELGVLSVMINHANDAWDWHLPNPVIGRRPKASKNRVRWARPQEATQLIQIAQNRSSTPWLADFIELALNTGMRKSEILQCELSRVDLLNNCIHLYPEHQKNGRYGTIALNQKALKVLSRRLEWIEKYCPDTPWLFPSRIGKGAQHMTCVKKPFAAACEKAGLTDFRPHDLRHTFASWLAQAGVPLLELMEVMRHADIKQTEKYAHLSTGAAKRVVAVLDGHLTQYTSHHEN